MSSNNSVQRGSTMEEKKDDTDVYEIVEEYKHKSQPAESDDVDLHKPQEVFWVTLWNAMNPAMCLAPATACTQVLMDDEIVEYNRIMPPILRDMKHPGKARTTALQKLYRFTDRERQKNRVPVVCSTRFHTLDALIPCLGVEVAPHDRRQALLILNNLCIPSENKRTMLLGSSRDALLSTLMEILRKKLPECHLVTAALFNLSFYEETKAMLLHYVPTVSLKHTENETPEEYSFSQPSQKQDSLLRILEQTVREFLPYYVKHCGMVGKVPPGTKLPVSVEASTLRWTMCFMRNLATDPEHAHLLATTTTLPGAALQILQVAADLTDLSQWSHDSLPEACLVLWVWLVQSSEDTCRHLYRQYGEDSELSAIKALEPITQEPGIHGVRAKMVSAKLHSIFANLTAEERLKTMASF